MKNCLCKIPVLMRLSFFVLFSVLIQGALQAQIVTAATDISLGSFINPPNSAKPRVWWHWMNGNVTIDGISKDLAWMNRSGIGGFQNFDAALATPQIVKTRLTYMTPAWREAFQFTTKLADSLHLEMAIAGSPGWSESGGPWVKPEDGMKKIVWTEMRVKGGDINIVLTKPAGTTGPFQNIPLQPGLGETADKDGVKFYKDIAVIACKLTETDKSLIDLHAVVTSSGGNFNLNQLTDGDLSATNLLPSDTVKGYAWILFTFPEPQTIKAVTMVGGGDKGPFGMYGEFKDTRSLEVSDDGINFNRICYIPAGNVLQQTIAIPVTTSKYFRITVKNPPPPFSFGSMLGSGAEKPKQSPGTKIAELVLYSASRINMFEEKDAFAPATGLYAKASPETKDVIPASEIINITNKLNADGTLNWTVPPGNWNIIRLGYSLLGITNHPASPEATGLEVDKLDPVAVRNYSIITWINIREQPEALWAIREVAIYGNGQLGSRCPKLDRQSFAGISKASRL